MMVGRKETKSSNKSTNIFDKSLNEKNYVQCQEKENHKRFSFVNSKANIFFFFCRFLDFQCPFIFFLVRYPLLMEYLTPINTSGNQTRT